MPNISFIIPVWDGDIYLAETLESIRNQTLKDIEIIVIDDCSPDFTPELMEWYVKKDERIKYHRLDVNGGVCAARNYGNKLAESDLICVNDQDDLSDQYRAKFCVEYFKKYPETQCLTGAYYEANSDGIPVRKYEPEVITKESLLDDSYRNSGGWLHSSACYKKSDSLRIPYREMGEETDDHRFLVDWLDAGMIFKSTKKLLSYKRMGPNREMALRLAIRKEGNKDKEGNIL